MKNCTHVYPSIVIEKKFAFLWYYYTSNFEKVFICLLFVSYLFIKWTVRNNKKALLSVIENNARIMFLFLNLSHQSHAVLEACLVCSSHLGGSSFTYDVKELVEGRELCFGQRLFKGYAELVNDTICYRKISERVYREFLRN